MNEIGLADAYNKKIVFIIFDDLTNLPYPEILKKYAPADIHLNQKIYYEFKQIDKFYQIANKLIKVT